MVYEAGSSGVGLKRGVIISANITALLLGAVIVWIAYRVGGSFHVNMLICVLGGLIGGGIGILASPFNQTEEARFISLGQAVSAFVSGYLISKLDRFLEITLFTQGGVHNNAWARAGLFIASCLVTMLIVFKNRTYWLAARTP